MLPGSKLFDSEKNMQMKRGLDQNTKMYKEPLWQKLGRGALDVFVGTKGFSRDGIQSYVQGAISKQAQEWMSPWIDGMKAENKAVLERLGQGNADIVSELQKITNNTGIANDMNNRLQVPQGGNVTNNLFNSNSNLGGEFSELTQTMNKWMTEFSLDNVKA